MALYFNVLEEILKENNLFQYPSQICNVDEHGVLLDPKAPNIVTKKNARNILYNLSGKKDE